jgi:hypothetical protein
VEVVDMAAHSTLLKGVIGGTSLAVLAAAAIAFGGTVSHSVFAATPSPTPQPALNESIHRLPGGIFVAPSNPPTITGLELQPVVSPGGEIKIDGLNFGTERGTVCLRWSSVLVQNDFTAGDQFCLTVVDWQDTRIIALVPSDVEGVADQTAQLSVYPASGGGSNSVDMQFVATRAVTEVYGPNIKATIDCSNNTQRDECDFGFAKHEDGSLFISFGNSGTDHYHVQLANGWVFNAYRFNRIVGDAAFQGEPQIVDGTADIAVHWSVSGFDTDARYSFTLYAYGPKGVPLQ